MSESSDGDEYLVTRLEHVEPVLNVINVYGQQEGRNGQEGRDKVLESWVRIKKELSFIEMRGEAALLIGDFNRAVGNDDLGVVGNKKNVSYGGSLLRDLLEEGEYVMFNNLNIVEGGPWTILDPAGGSPSLLDLAIGSANLVPFLASMTIDNGRDFTPKRVVACKGKLKVVYTDHLPIFVELKMPAG